MREKNHSVVSPVKDMTMSTIVLDESMAITELGISFMLDPEDTSMAQTQNDTFSKSLIRDAKYFQRKRKSLN